MKFKPTKLKLIVSIVAALIVNLFVMMFLAGCVGFLSCYTQALINAWFVWLVVLVIIYAIWSLIQKK